MKKSIQTGAIKKNLRSSAAQNAQERLLNSMSPMLFNTSITGQSNPNNSQSDTGPNSFNPIFDTDPLGEQRPPPRVLRTPIDFNPNINLGDQVDNNQNQDTPIFEQANLESNSNNLNNPLGQRSQNASVESDSITAPSYSSLSHLGAAGLNMDTINKVRDEPILEKPVNSVPPGSNNSSPKQSEQESMKAYINLTIVNAFSSYAESMKSEISESLKKMMRDNFIEFLGDMNTATLPLRREESSVKTSSQTIPANKPLPPHYSQQQQQTQQQQTQQPLRPQQNLQTNVLPKPQSIQTQFAVNGRNNSQSNSNGPGYSQPSQRTQSRLQQQLQLKYHPPPQQNRSFPNQQFQPEQPFQNQNRSSHQPFIDHGLHNPEQLFPSAFAHTSNVFKPIQRFSDTGSQPPGNYARNEGDFGNQNPVYSNREPYSNPNITRHHHEPVKLDRWGLKYDGKPENLSVEDFVHRLEFLQHQYQCPWSEILRQFHLTLSGDAERWYWEFIKFNHSSDWPTLRDAIKLHFRNCKSDYEIMREISDRKQGPTESCDSYFSAIAKIRSQLTIPIPEIELIRMIKRNLNDQIGKLVYPISIFNFDQLRFACKEAENAFPVRPPQVPRYYRPPLKMHVNEVHAMEEEEPYDEYLAAMQYAEKHRPRPPNRVLTCWNCKVDGHLYWECPSPKVNIFCFKCGEANYIVATCPKCRQKNLSKSTITTGESCSKTNPEPSNHPQ